MERRRIGDAGVGAVALGGANWTFLDVDPAQVEATLDEAVALGVTLIDTAFAYTMADEQCHLAWLLAQSPVVIPIVGASRPASIRDAAEAVDLRLSEDELTRIAEPAPTVGAGDTPSGEARRH
jgi:aryl-alcohol dehydrogenase-like predicted oxidoreductase